MAQGRQAKILTTQQQQMMLDHVTHLRHPVRDRVIVLLSFRAGLRVKEISSITWSMVTDVEGAIADSIALTNKASKGKRGGRTIPIHPDLHAALTELQRVRGLRAEPQLAVIYSDRGTKIGANALAIWFGKHYRTLGFEGASSHSGRRTFGTTAAKKIGLVGGSIRDVQQLLGHSSLVETQKYIEGDAEAKRRVVDLL